jgi:YjbE family integral membrane protein
MFDFVAGPDFWIGLLKIVWINIVLSGDNAVVIAMAARSLRPEEQRKAIAWGSGFAVVLRIALTVVAVQLMALPFLQIIGGLLLLWIGTQLLNEEAESEEDAKTHHNLYAAIRTILIADLVMSLDNVIGVAAAAKGNLLLLTIGLGLSIPLVIFGSSLMIGLMTRFPVIISLGAALIGWVAGETLISDVLVVHLISHLTWLHWLVPAACALFVLTSPRWIALLRKPQDASPADTVEDGLQK